MKQKTRKPKRNTKIESIVSSLIFKESEVFKTLTFTKELLKTTDRNGLSLLGWLCATKLLNKISPELIEEETLLEFSPFGNCPMHTAIEVGIIHDIPKKFLTIKNLLVKRKNAKAPIDTLEITFSAKECYNNLKGLKANKGPKKLIKLGEIYKKFHSQKQIDLCTPQKN